MNEGESSIWRHNRVAALGVRLCCSRRGAEAFTTLYAYFRWADDRVDAPNRDPAAVRRFVEDQATLLRGRREAVHPFEQHLTRVLRGPLGPGLSPAVLGMWEALRFDSERGERALLAEELTAQVVRVGDAWMVALWVCLECGEALPDDLRELSRAASLVHVLRDRELDRSLGYLNTPPGTNTPAAMSAWVRERAGEAESRFERGLVALGTVRSWRARVLMTLLVWRYRATLRRVLERA